MMTMDELIEAQQERVSQVQAVYNTFHPYYIEAHRALDLMKRARGDS